MNLRKLIAPLLLYRIQGELELSQIQITSIEMDSRRVTAGSLFVCLEGSRHDGHQFAYQAKEKGAVAILAQKPVNIELPVILVPDTRRALAILANQFYQYPSSKLRLIGVTGTNGKTTTTYFIEKILEDLGIKTGRIGTIGMKIDREFKEIANTTPESVELQKSFCQMVTTNTKYAVLEVSSHAIHLGRTRGCNFGILVFTNLTHDHLDFHGSMEEYRRIKGLAFAQLGNKYEPSDWKYAILNRDDHAYEYLHKITPAQVLTYGIENEAEVRATNICLTQSGTSFTVETYQGREDFQVSMLGKFNIYNMLAAIGVGLVEGVSLTQIKESLGKIKGVRGRLELVDLGQNFTVIVDYAHTPDSLENVLMTIKEFAQRKIYCIVGCGGDRDRQKRPLMARTAVGLADFTIFTTDNPRSEDPEGIIRDMLAGLNQDETPQTKYKCIIDRQEAIEWAIERALQKDVILIAGKGHETYQLIKGRTLPFDDREVAKNALKKRLEL